MRTAYALLGLAFLIVFGLAFLLYEQSERQTFDFAGQYFALSPPSVNLLTSENSD